MMSAVPQGLLELPFGILTGPTASGKSALALAAVQRMAQELPIEIISVDSALVYQGMDIGTAKPTAEELRQARHHLIDIRQPHETYSAAEFVRDAGQLIESLVQQGRFPLLVGGTMLYLHALLNGLDPLPQADAQVRSELELRAQQKGWPAMHAWLAQVDPETAQRLAPQDSQRIQRALEVWLVAGQPLSQLQQRSKQDTSWQDVWIAQRVISVEPTSRAWLHERIAKRFDLMMAQGFMDEMQRLRANPQLQADLPSMRSVGYRQAWQVLDGQMAPSELPERAIAATRQLAKRQMTWLRSMPTRQVLASDEQAQSAQVERLLDAIRVMAGH